MGVLLNTQTDYETDVFQENVSYAQKCAAAVPGIPGNAIPAGTAFVGMDMSLPRLLFEKNRPAVCFSTARTSCQTPDQF